MSSGSPMMSERTTENTFAGAQYCAKRPPLTAERCLRSVFISTMFAPQASSCFVMSSSSAAGMSGFSKSAEPPPESRKSTVSSAVRFSTSFIAASAEAKEFSSGTGWPASMMRVCGSSPFECPYFVTTSPSSILSPSIAQAVLAICHAALPTATMTSLPGPNSRPSSALATAVSGSAARSASAMILSASSLILLIVKKASPFVKSA